MLEVERPQMSDLNSQYYSAALQAQLLYLKVEKELEKIVNNADYLRTYFASVFENTNYATYLLEKVGEANGTDKHN